MPVNESSVICDLPPMLNDFYPSSDSDSDDDMVEKIPK